MSSLSAPAACGADSCTRMNIYVMKREARGFRSSARLKPCPFKTTR